MAVKQINDITYKSNVKTQVPQGTLPQTQMQRELPVQSNWGAIGKVFDQFANLGKDILGMVQRNDQDVVDNSYRDLGLQLQKKIGEIPADIEKAPEHIEQARQWIDDSVGNMKLNERQSEKLKNKLYMDLQNRTVELIAGGDAAREKRLRATLSDNVEEAARHENKKQIDALFSEADWLPQDEKEAAYNAAIKKFDYYTVFNDLQTLPISDAIKILENPDTYDGSELYDGVFIDTDQREELKKSLIDSDTVERRAAATQFGESFNQLRTDIGKGLTRDEFLSAPEGSYPGITDRADAWDKAKGIIKKEVSEQQQDAYNEMAAKIVAARDSHGHVTGQTRQDLAAELNRRASDFGPYLTTLSNMLTLPMPATGGKTAEDLQSEAVLENIQDALITGKTTPQEAVAIGSNAVGKGDLKAKDWDKLNVFMKNFENATLQSLLDKLNTGVQRKRFEDSHGNFDQGKYDIAKAAIRQVISENDSADIKLNSAQLDEKYNSIVKILTDESIKKDLDGVYNEKARGAFYSWKIGDLDRTVKRLVSGDLMALKEVDPGQYEQLSNYLNEQARAIAKEDFPDKKMGDAVRLYEGYLPVYTLDNEEYVMDVSDNGKYTQLTPLEEAINKHKNLAYGKPIGSVFENMVLTYDGYKTEGTNPGDLVEVVIGGSKGYGIRGEDGRIDPNKPAYVIARKNNGEITFAPIYSSLNDVAGVTKELQSITEIPMSPEQALEQKIKLVGTERYNELMKELAPYGGGE